MIMELFEHAPDHITLAAALIMLFSILSQYLSWRLKVPSILFLILSGIMLGPLSEALLGGFKLVDGDTIFGDGLSPFVSICVAIILFEGSLSLNFSRIKNVSNVVFLLSTVGLGITIILTSMFCHYVLGLGIELSLLIGGITCVSGPTVVPPLMRTIRPKKHVANILKWESIIVDPIGALVVVLMLTWFSFGGDFSGSGYGAWLFALYILFVCALGTLAGLLIGYLIGICFRKNYIPEYLKNFFVLSVIVIGFIVIDSVMNGSGLLMVTVAGIVIANMKYISITDIISFKENLSILIISVLFIVLSAEIDFRLIKEHLLDLIELFLFLQFVLRPLVVYLCSFKSNTTMAERFVMGMIYPRGIVAASVVALVSVKILMNHPESIAQVDILVFFVFMIIVFSVVFQSIFTPYISRLLKVTEPESKGFLIIGGNRFGREIASIFGKHDIDVVIADSSWTNVQTCRQMGLNTYYGSPVSTNADMSINLVGLGNMLGLSSSEYVNAVAAIKYRSEFGAQHTHVLRSPQKESYKGVGGIQTNLANLLFDNGIDFNVLAGLFNKGARIKSTNITANYTLDDFVLGNPDALLLFVIYEGGVVDTCYKDKKIKQVSYSLVSLAPETKINKEQLCLDV